MLYIQRRGNGQRETVDEFATRKEATKMLAEYRLADPTAEHYISTRPCKGWQAEQTEGETRVIFRAFKDTGDVIAFFVDIEERTGECSSYMRVGQHGTASYPNDRTRPATQEEYASLKRELEGEPYKYNLRVITRYARRRTSAQRKASSRG